MPNSKYPLSAVIDPVTREILFDRSNGSVVELDGNLLTIEFKMPKIFGQFDPDSKPFGSDDYAVDVNYTQEDPKYDPDSGYTASIDDEAFFEEETDDYVHFTWTPSSFATLKDGWLWFSIRVYDHNGNSWATKAKKIRVWPNVAGAAHDRTDEDKDRARFAVLYLPQDLNPSEKAQARSNIGVTDDGQALISGKNLVNSYSAADKNAGTRHNVVADGETATILYRDNRVDDGNGNLVDGDYMAPYFRINLMQPLAPDVDYILSFKCFGSSGLQNIPQFMLTDRRGNIISDPFSIHDGILVVPFTPDHMIYDYVVFHEAPVAGERTLFNTSIKISEIQIEAGTTATEFELSSASIFEKAKEASDLTHLYIENASQDGWATAEFEGMHMMASTAISAKNVHLMSQNRKKAWFTSAVERAPYYNVSDEIFIPFPFPTRYTHIIGAADRGMIYICNVNGIGGRGSVGARFRLATPYYNVPEDEDFIIPEVTLRIFTSDRRHSIPQAPEYAYRDATAREIVAAARSYISAQESGRQFVYGANILYSEDTRNPRSSNGRITDKYGRAIMECDTFVGMCLRGIRYEYSPYNPDFAFPHASCGWQYTEGITGGWEQASDGSWSYVEPISGTWSQDPDEVAYAQNPANGVNREKNKRIVGENLNTGYEQFIIDTRSKTDSSGTGVVFWESVESAFPELGIIDLPTWALKLREQMSSSVAYSCYGRAMKYACDYSWMFWVTSSSVEFGGHTKTIGCMFSDPKKAMPGDIAFFRKPDEKRWFDNISHVCIVTEADSVNGDVTIAEVTGRASSGGRIVQEIRMSQRYGDIAYFARPYGWY